MRLLGELQKRVPSWVETPPLRTPPATSPPGTTPPATTPPATTPLGTTPPGTQPHADSADSTSGVDGNTRLTAATGMVLFVLLAVEGVTLLSIRQLITVHVFVGVLLLGPVLLKSSSTLYRFLR